VERHRITDVSVGVSPFSLNVARPSFRVRSLHRGASRASLRVPRVIRTVTVATALANPGIVPRSVDLEDLRARAATLTRLAEIQRTLHKLNEKVEDTTTKLGSDLYGVARSVYSVMKSPATVPGLTERKAKLGQRFARKASSRPNEAPSPAAA